ncbi:GlmU family protein [Pontibacter silvestris]|uniref:GlmU family protein n=1 Tax=Pontibacter silvestris TaxID=2305183 RepID=A0ABW4WTU0_9BACT|nr:GlmU family protein [Pontibacter silvestris]MCC9137274.1 GlmU family protein [Pontibacter silvestris]
MNIILFDEPSIREALLPLTFTRPVAEIRVGILTIAEKWRKFLGENVSYLTQPYLQDKFDLVTDTHNWYINGAVCPDESLVETIKSLKMGEALYHQGILIAINSDNLQPHDMEELVSYSTSKRHECDTCTIVKEMWEIFQFNGQQIRNDFKILTAGRQSQPLNDRFTAVYGEENIFIEEGAIIRAAVLNAEDGPIYIGKDTQVLEGALIKGPFALCEGSFVNMGGKMRGDTTIGPFSKVGGEVSNSVIFGYSNKGHEGFLGNSVLGEWCNLGADTNTSNLKNNYAQVKMWSHAQKNFRNTGLQFCGLIMGDHSKCSINTMFNTGTVVGVSANIFGAGFPSNFVPSFSWGGASGLETYQFQKACEVAAKVLERRDLKLDDIEKAVLREVFKETQQYRTWDS